MKRIVSIFSVALILSACSTGSRPGSYFEDDGPHKNVKIDIAKIPDATPRWERVDPSRSRPYTVLGKKYYPMTEARNYREIGVASWYGRKFHGRRTSLGERYDMYTMTAAHKTLPLPSYVRVRNLKNNHTVVVRVNDRGPFLHKRLIDLSYAAAYKLGMIGSGTTEVEVMVITPGFKAAPPPAVMATTEDSDATEIKTRAVDETTLLRAEKITTTASETVYFQVGAFGSAENAENLRARLEQANITPVLILPVKKNDTRLYRVRIGPLDDIEKSEATRRRLEEFGIADIQMINE